VAVYSQSAQDAADRPGSAPLVVGGPPVFHGRNAPSPALINLTRHDNASDYTTEKIGYRTCGLPPNSQIDPEIPGAISMF